MRSSPPRTEFFTENSFIDNEDHRITNSPCGDTCDWRSSSFTTLSPKMYSCKLHDELPTTSVYGLLNQSKIERLTLACHSSSKELQRNLSMSSDSSVSEIMEDHTGLLAPESKMPLEGLFDTNYLDNEAELWNFWFSPKQQDLPIENPFFESSTAQSLSLTSALSPTSNYLPPTRPPLHLQDSSLSAYNRNFALMDLSSLHPLPESPNITPQSNANQQSSEATRTPWCTQQHLNVSSPTSTYSPFPQCNTTTTLPRITRPSATPIQPYQQPASESRPKTQERAPHASYQDDWPPRVSSRLSRRIQQQPTQFQTQTLTQVQQEQTRERAYTTPSRSLPLPHHPQYSSKQPRHKSHPLPSSHNTTHYPSNLSTCTTLLDSPQMVSSNSSNFYICSTPTSPNNPHDASGSAPKSYHELMDLMLQEKSFFETDDDEDEEKSSLRSLLEGNFHLRSHFGGEKETLGGFGVGNGEKRSLKVKAKSAGEAIRGVLRIRKSVG